ncbi:putative MFS family arabinose efflux permease [Streptomyces sp. TLI_146]|nr:putative MFS family arabinose efflux permease [Streptomyces sp. TLI_146]
MLRSAPSVAPMTTSSPSRTPAAPTRPPLLTRALALRFVSMVGASASLFLLLSAVPLYARESGAGGDTAGLATGALMLATVLGELGAPRLVARFGYRAALAAGLFLLGAPALVLTASGTMAWIVAVCFLRGLGFALTLVAGGALTASLIPAERRGEGLALVGVVGGVPNLVALPLGVWLGAHVGYGTVSVIAGAVALVAIASVPGLPDRELMCGESVGVLAGLRTGALVRPGTVFAATAVAAGIVVTFVPLAVPSSMGAVATAALFVQPAVSTAGRWWAGRLGDRHGAARLVLPGLLLSAAGVLMTALIRTPVAVLGGVALFGAGFGIAQNATLTLMYARVSTASYGTVSALWNLAYDGGMGVGAVGFGVLADRTGYSSAFVLTAALMLVAAVPAVRDRRTDPATRRP